MCLVPAPTPGGAYSKEGDHGFRYGRCGCGHGEELPFKVVFMQGETVLAGAWLVEFLKEDGEGQIVETLKSLVEDDELEDEDDAA